MYNKRAPPLLSKSVPLSNEPRIAVQTTPRNTPQRTPRPVMIPPAAASDSPTIPIRPPRPPRSPAKDDSVATSKFPVNYSTLSTSMSNLILDLPRSQSPSPSLHRCSAPDVCSAEEVKGEGEQEPRQGWDYFILFLKHFSNTYLFTLVGDVNKYGYTYLCSLSDLKTGRGIKMKINKLVLGIFYISGEVYIIDDNCCHELVPLHSLFSFFIRIKF